MHGHQSHAVVPGLLAVQVCVQSNLVQKARQGGVLGIVLQKRLDTGAELLYVFQAAPALRILLFLEHGCIAAAAAHIIIKLHQAHFIRLAAHFVYHRCKAD